MIFLKIRTSVNSIFDLIFHNLNCILHFDPDKIAIFKNFTVSIPRLFEKWPRQNRNLKNYRDFSEFYRDITANFRNFTATLPRFLDLWLILPRQKLASAGHVLIRILSIQTSSKWLFLCKISSGIHMDNLNFKAVHGIELSAMVYQ